MLSLVAIPCHSQLFSFEEPKLNELEFGLFRLLPKL